MPATTPHAMILTSRWDPHIRRIRTPNLVVALAGDCLSDDQAVKHALITATTAHRAVRELLRLPGRFGVAVDDGTVLAAAGDLAGTVRWWWTRHADRVLVALSPLPLARLHGTRINPLALSAGLFLPDVPGLTEDTVYCGVRELSPSRVLVVSGDRVTTTPRPALPAVPVDEAPEALAAALTLAVRARTAGATTVSTDLSGGLDSSTLAILAARGAAIPVTALTYTDPYAVNDDDTAYAARLAADQPGLDHRVLTGGPGQLPFTDLDAAPFSDLPSLDTLLHTRTRYRLTPAAGADVHLVGDGGDVVLGAPLTYLADLAHPATGRRFLAECAGWARLRHRPAHRLVRAAISVSRTSYRAALDAAATGLDAAPEHHPDHNPAIERSLVWVRVSAAARWAPQATRARVADLLRAHHPEDPQDGVDAHTLRQIRGHGAATRGFLHMAAGFGVPVAAPFFDNSVLAACLSVPASHRATVRQAKPLLGRAFTGRLPAELFDRRTKGDYSACEYHGVRTNASRLRTLLDESRLADLDIIDPAAVRTDLDAAISGARAPMGALHQVLAAEVWLRQLETTGEA